jgi:hypothetical protein
VSAAIPFANDAITLQLAELFQHLADIDAGDGAEAGAALSAALPPDIAAAARGSAAFAPSVGPSSHAGPRPSLALVMRAARA